jgi:hypothetical protein
VVGTSWMSDRLFVRVCGFIFGLVLFGKPLMDRVGARLDRIVLGEVSGGDVATVGDWLYDPMGSGWRHVPVCAYTR